MIDFAHILDWPEYVKLLIGLVAIVNPIGAMPLSISLTANREAAERRRIALVAALVAVGVMVLFTFLGSSWISLASLYPHFASRVR